MPHSEARISSHCTTAHLRFDLSLLGFGAQGWWGQHDFTKGDIICATDGLEMILKLQPWPVDILLTAITTPSDLRGPNQLWEGKRPCSLPTNICFSILDSCLSSFFCCSLCSLKESYLELRINTHVSPPFHQHSKWEYLLFLLLGLAFAAGLLLIVCVQLGLSVHLVLSEEQDVFGLILHPPHVGFLTLLLSPLEVRNRYVNITRITCGDD